MTRIKNVETFEEFGRWCKDFFKDLVDFDDGDGAELWKDFESNVVSLMRELVVTDSLSWVCDDSSYQNILELRCLRLKDQLIGELVSYNDGSPYSDKLKKAAVSLQKKFRPLDLVEGIDDEVFDWM